MATGMSLNDQETGMNNPNKFSTAFNGSYPEESQPENFNFNEHDPEHVYAAAEINNIAGRVSARGMNKAAAELEYNADNAAAPFNDDIDGTLQQIVQLQVEAANQGDEVAAEGYDKLYTSTVQTRRVLTENGLFQLIEPLNLIIDRVYNYVKLHGYKVLFSSTFDPVEIGLALDRFIDETIGSLPPPNILDSHYKLARNIVNPIVETANCMIQAFGKWMKPAVEHINHKLCGYLNPLYEQAIEQLEVLKDKTRAHFEHLPTIEKIYLGDSLIQLLQFGYANSEFIINSLLQSRDFSKAIFEITTNTANTLYSGINGTRRLIMNIQGMSFNMLVFLIYLSRGIYGHRHPHVNMDENLENLCVDYAATALYKIHGAYANTPPGQDVAIIYGNIIYHAINTTLQVVKTLHLFAYAANPYLIGGFVAYTLGIYINSFHSEPISLFHAFAQTYGIVFGQELPNAVRSALDRSEEIIARIMDRQHELEDKDKAAQALVDLMNTMGQQAQDQGIADIAVNENPLPGAANEAVNENPLLDATNEAVNENLDDAAGPPINTEMGSANEGGKARRRKTIKKKHTKKTHKRKSKKAGKVRKVKKARKSKAKKAHKGKRHTKRRS